jgi:hypothetical protein
VLPPSASVLRQSKHKLSNLCPTAHFSYPERRSEGLQNPRKSSQPTKSSPTKFSSGKGSPTKPSPSKPSRSKFIPYVDVVNTRHSASSTSGPSLRQSRTKLSNIHHTAHLLSLGRLSQNFQNPPRPLQLILNSDGKGGKETSATVCIIFQCSST